MPSKSQSQRAWAFGVKGPAWAKEHHFDNPGKLPKYVEKDNVGRVNVGLALFKAQMQKRKLKK